MRTTNRRTRGVTHFPMAADISRPSDLLMNPVLPTRAPWRWLRPLLIVLGTTAALAVLLGTGELL